MGTSRLNNLAPGWASKFNLAGDCAALAIMGTVASSHAGAWTWHEPLLIAGAAIAAWVLAAKVLRQYDIWHKQGALGELALTTVLILGIATELFVLRLVLPASYMPNLLIGQFLGLTLPTMLFLRLFVVGVRAMREQHREDVVVVGASALGRVTGEDLLANASEPRNIVGYLRFREDPVDPRLPAPLLGDVTALEEVLKDKPTNEVYIAGNMVKNGEAMQGVIKICEKFGVPFALPAHGFRFGRARAKNPKMIEDGYIHYQSVEPKPVQVAMKRFFDILLSATALWALSPILIVAALAVKLTSRGPVLFKQGRVGMHGRPFNMLKFRSMVVNAEELKGKLMAQNEQTGPVFKMKHDPRITAVGRFIRKYSIDELPQLINVLRGEMSIVGPRPNLPREVAEYEPWQRRRLSVRPGLTCVWQVSGRNEISFEQWMYLDMQYIDNWSLQQDFELILKTVPVVLTGRGAS
jgi:exopolysaccharide biosynthesis polyprenyl glycosylphosphotransferase